MSRLIVISNRVSAVGGQLASARGGLAVALTAALRDSGGLWFGWSGNRTDRFTGDVHLNRADGVTVATIDLEEQDIEEYYNGYANRTLWPLFHDRIDLAEFERDFAGGYQRANDRFAEAVHPLIQEQDAIWVQDYHLIPLGHELRKLGCRNRMGFFLHIPWPPPRLLSALPEARALVETMFSYDLIGFHTADWLDAFCEYAVGELGAELDGNVLRLRGRNVRLIDCPIGIDSQHFAELAESPKAKETIEMLRRSSSGRSLIVGVDRLDYSKGLEERFNGYERFLAEHPDDRKAVYLLQIAPPSRASVDTYQRIRETLDALSGRINGAHADLDWVPIRYVNHNYSRDVLAGVFREAKMALVTPLCDGMNLVAKEFVAAQNPEDPGVLILSRFAGAALQLRDALLINPHSPEEISDAIARALRMPLDERIARWEKMKACVDEQDVRWWRKRFTDALFAVPAAKPAPALV